jgi:hypothetical protein
MGEKQPERWSVAHLVELVSRDDTIAIFVEGE